MKPKMLTMTNENEAVRAPTSADLDQPLPVTPLKTGKSGRVPGTKRARKFGQQVERAKRAILAGEIEPKARPIAEHCQCAHRTALSILQILTEQGVVVRDGRGWKRAA